MLASKFILTLFAIAATASSTLAYNPRVRRSSDLVFGDGEAGYEITARGGTPFRREYRHPLVARAITSTTSTAGPNSNQITGGYRSESPGVMTAQEIAALRNQQPSAHNPPQRLQRAPTHDPRYTNPPPRYTNPPPPYPHDSTYTPQTSRSSAQHPNTDRPPSYSS